MSLPCHGTTHTGCGAAAAARVLRGARRDRRVSVIALLAVVAVMHGVAASNPGYYNDDELGVLMAAQERGWEGLAGRLSWPWEAGAGFSRPLAFCWLWAELLFLGAWPRLVHAVDLLVHLVNTALVFSLLRGVPLLARRAWIGALVFGIGPCVTTTVCWTADAYGRLCMAAVLMGTCVVRGRTSVPGAAAAGGLTAVLALLCKEFAILLPLGWAGVAVSVGDGARRRWHAAAVAGGVVVILFLACRAVPLLELSGRTAEAPSGYDLEVGHVPVNALSYLVWSFVPTAMVPGPPRPSITWIGSLVLCAVFAVWALRGSRRLGAAGLGLFVVALLPVLPLTKSEGQHLYFAAPFLALAWLAVHTRFPRMAWAFLLLWLLHAQLLQVSFWREGDWVRRVWGQYVSRLERGVRPVRILPEDERARWTARRIFSGARQRDAVVFVDRREEADLVLDRTGPVEDG